MMNVKICRFLSEDIGHLQKYEIINRKMVENRVKGIFYCEGCDIREHWLQGGDDGLEGIKMELDQLGGSCSDLGDRWCCENDLKVLHSINFHTAFPSTYSGTLLTGTPTKPFADSGKNAVLVKNDNNF